ncbi:MAG: DUF2189 domain-containing protein [Proteobacteria bacterium]|nr:DUF2189 domain-containing protein [Pseudomonadota bacterium]
MSAATSSLEMYPVHQVPLTRPFIWLAQGWDDLLHHRGASLAYGALASGMGALILAYDRNPIYVACAVVAFLFIGPIVTAGLCELSRARDHGEESNFQSSLLALRVNRRNLLPFAEVLGVMALTWFVGAAGLLYLQSGSFSPSVTATVGGDVLRHLSEVQIFVYGLTLASLAVIVFAFSVVTVPMIIERHVDAKSAIRMSLRVVRLNFVAMVVWAGLICGLVMVGFATGLLAMVVIFPLLGHATWCAYRDLVEGH